MTDTTPIREGQVLTGPLFNEPVRANGDADLEEGLLRPMEERQFRNICRNVFEGPATKSLSLEMLVGRRALALERRVGEDGRPWREFTKVEHDTLEVEAMTPDAEGGSSGR